MYAVPFELRNPLPEQLVDSRELRELYKKYAIVPYYGDYEESSHAYLTLIDQLSRLSPSYRSCQADIKTLSFGSSLSVLPIANGMVDLEEEPLAKADAEAYWRQMAEYGLHKSTFVDLAKTIYKHEDDCGNAYVKITIVKVGDSIKINFKPLHYRKTAYLFTKGFEAKQIIYTPVWSEDYWRTTQKPEILPASFIGEDFNWKESANKFETILHLRELSDMSDFYGYSATESLLYWMYVEHINADVSVKIAATEVVSKTLLAFEEEDPAKKVRTKTGQNTGPAQNTNDLVKPKSALQVRMEALRKLTTTEGDKPSVIAGITYPFGTKAPIAIKLELSRDWEFDANLVTKASSHIYQAHKWYRELTGFVQQRAGIGSNMIRDLMIVAGSKAILPQQLEKSDMFAFIFGQLEKITKKPFLGTIVFPNLVDKLVEQINIANGKAGGLNNAVSGTPVDSGSTRAEAE